MQSHRRHRKIHHLLAPLALAISAMLMAAPTTVAAGADIYGVGGGSQDFGSGTKVITFAFSAHTGPQGDFGSLKWTIEDPNFPLEVHVDITCVNVTTFGTGAGGFIGGPVKRVTPASNAYGVSVGDEQVFGINDLGNPSSLTADEFNAYQGPFFDQFCKQIPPFPQSPISQGNINIKLP